MGGFVEGDAALEFLFADVAPWADGVGGYGDGEVCHCCCCFVVVVFVLMRIREARGRERVSECGCVDVRSRLAYVAHPPPFRGLL